MKKFKALKICLAVVLLITIAGLSGCGKAKNEPTSSQSGKQSSLIDKGTGKGKTKLTKGKNSVTTPYVIDTVAKTEFTDTYTDYYSYTADKDDNIYYIYNNCIYKANVYSGTPNMILDANDIIIDNDEMALSDFNITSIAYDDNTNKLLITGNFYSVNSAKDVNSYYLYSLTGNTAKAIGPTIEDTVLIKVLKSGDYVIYDGSLAYIVNSQTYEGTKLDTHNVYDVYDNGTELYIASLDALYKYNFIEITKEWDTNAHAIGINNEYVALARDNTINLCNLKGKILKTVDNTNVTVLDRNRVDTSAFTKKLMFTSKGDIVFYDKTAKSLRIIKKNNAANNSTKSTSQK